MAQWRAKIRSTALLVAAAVVLAGCAAGGGTSPDSSPSADEPKVGGVLTVAYNADGKSLDSATCSSLPDRCGPIYGILIRYDIDKGDFVGDMADSFTSEDGKVWTLKLRDGVEFSDGTPFDADAVVFNWDRIADPATLSNSIALTKGLTWKAIDPLTVQVTSSIANFQLPWALTKGLGSIGSPTAMKELGPDFGTKPVGAGPFVVSTWTQGTELVLVRNDNYFQKGLPYLDGLTLKFVGADDQRLNALRAGQIDVDWSLLAKDAKAIESEGEFTVTSLPIVGGTGLQFNRKDPVAGDEDLIQAMLHAFDSEQIVSAVYPGNDPTDAFLRPDNPNRDDSLGTFPELDLKKAQSLFDAYLKKTGKDSETISFLTYAGFPALEQVAQLIQSQMQQIKGLTVTIDGVDAATLQTRVGSGDFQTVLGTSSGYEMDILYQLAHTDGSLNYGKYSNADVDEALELTRSSDDPEAVKQAYELINGEISKDGVLRIFRYNVGFLYSNPDVQGMIVSPSGNAIGAYFQSAWLDD